MQNGGDDRGRRGIGLPGLFIIVALLAAALFWWALHPEGGGLITYRWQANQWAAVSALRGYVTAQVTFSFANQAAVPGNTSPQLGEKAYADNFRNLYYGTTAGGKRLELIQKGVADAFLMDNALSGAPTAVGAPPKATPYQGYLFQEDMFGMLPASRYGEKFAFMAFPAEYGVTGYKVFWIDETGGVKSFDPKADKGTPAHELAKRFYPSTPLADNPLAQWRDL